MPFSIVHDLDLSSFLPDKKRPKENLIKMAFSFKFFLAILSALFLTSEGLYFHLMRNEKKCFIEEMPEETIFQGHYSVKISRPNSMHDFVRVLDGG